MILLLDIRSGFSSVGRSSKDSYKGTDVRQHVVDSKVWFGCPSAIRELSTATVNSTFLVATAIRIHGSGGKLSSFHYW